MTPGHARSVLPRCAQLQSYTVLCVLRSARYIALADPMSLCARTVGIDYGFGCSLLIWRWLLLARALCRHDRAQLQSYTVLCVLRSARNIALADPMSLCIHAQSGRVAHGQQHRGGRARGRVAAAQPGLDDGARGLNMCLYRYLYVCFVLCCLLAVLVATERCARARGRGQPVEQLEFVLSLDDNHPLSKVQRLLLSKSEFGALNAICRRWPRTRARSKPCCSSAGPRCWRTTRLQNPAKALSSMLSSKNEVEAWQYLYLELTNLYQSCGTTLEADVALLAGKADGK
jgi:hypothetical protein